MKLLKLTFIFAFLFTFIDLNAQDQEIIMPKDTFETPDTWPEYPGGDQARYSYIAKNIRYPEIDKAAGVQGTVFVNFIIEEDGSITNAKVLRGVSASIDKEALIAVSGMPKWKPALKDDKPIRSQFNMPIRFILAGVGDTVTEKELTRKEKRALKKKQKEEAKANK